MIVWLNGPFASAGRPGPATLAPPEHGELRPLLTEVGKSALCIPDEYVTTVVDVAPWAAAKWRAILAHRSEVARGRTLPGLLARLPEATRHKIIQTEYFTRLRPGPVPRDPHQITT
ncbi:hypothetical protein [Streptomyces colonosanans]|uniref:Uncharacterized protein n=1 Tax=Streptomyces colonosanans TaxID=1428652 RepID=A0A1S2NSV2_9ACTN|nr:hypothetical protein [Streptomyces colonosanans]OIJ84537.1 hypothetical protein BIV24_30975 [Streptomyces colonosanans]